MFSIYWSSSNVNIITINYRKLSSVKCVSVVMYDEEFNVLVYSSDNLCLLGKIMLEINRRYVMKKFIVCLLLLFSLTGCINQNTIDNLDKEWITYQGIVTGETNSTEVENILGVPLDKIELTEQKSVYYQYPDFSIISQNGKVTTITIKSNKAPVLENGITVGSTKDELMTCLPVEPEIVDYTGTIPAEVGKGGSDTLRAYYLIEYSSDHAKILSQNIIVLLSNGSMVDYAINQDNKVERISIMAKNE